MTGLGLSGPAVLFIGIAIVTCRPDRTSPAAACTISGVMKFSVPRSSSSPQRPQFLTASKISSNSRSVTRAGSVSVGMSCSPPAGHLITCQPRHPCPELGNCLGAGERADLQVISMLLWVVKGLPGADPGVGGGHEWSLSRGSGNGGVAGRWYGGQDREGPLRVERAGSY